MSRSFRVLPLVLLLGLAGCGGILPKPAAPPSLYRLTAASGFTATAAPVPVQLLIDAPSAEAALDTTRIALGRSATTLDYFADAAWTDRLPVVVQARLVQSFENSHRLAAVSAAATLFRVDAVLTTELHHFEASYDGAGAPHWRIEIAVKLIHQPDRKLVAERIFTGDVPAARNDMASIVDAADEDWRGVARQIVDWAADNLSRVPR